MYSIEKESEYKSYSSKEIDNLKDKRSVVCMDVSKDMDLLISGYSNGYFALWDLHTTKCIKLVTTIFKSGIITCKFLKNDKKCYEMLVSEMNGKVHKVVIKPGIFTTSVDNQVLLKNQSAFVDISVLSYEDENKKYFPEMQKLLIAGFACLEHITVLMLEPKELKLFVFEKPKNLKGTYVPEISFGVGQIPILKDESNPQPNEQKPQTLFTISWSKFIYIYSIQNQNNQIAFTLVGHYINSSPILRMGIISNSIIFFLDKDKLMKVINSSLIPLGDIQYNTSTEPPTPIIQSSFNPLLEEGINVDFELSFQTYVVDSENSNKATYNNYIINVDKSIYLLARKDFYQFKLLNWEQCLNNLNQKSQWMDALTLGLDIYHGRTTALADIPIDEYIRVTKVGHVLRNMIHHYIIIHTGNETRDRNYNERIIKCINICIEFCIDIDSVDFLLNNLQAIFDGKGFGNIFIERLEPFVLCDKIKHEQLQQNTISKIIELYTQKKKFQILSKILVHLDIKSIDIDYIRDYCNQYNLITPLIYVYTNSKLEDYFYPIPKIFEIFTKAKELDDFTDFRVIYKFITAEVEFSKQFIGHKLMWYIYMCIQGKKFPKNNIPEDKFKPLIIKILSWLLKDDTFKVLMEFDSICFFKILIKYFEEEKLKTILEKETKTQEINELKELKELKDTSSESLLEYIVLKGKKGHSNVAIQNLYEFIAKCSVYMQISKQVLIETGKFLLSSKKNLHVDLDSNYNLTQIEHINNLLIEMIESRSDLDSLEYSSLLIEAELSPYVLTKIFLLKKVKNYQRCLNEFLQNNTYIKKNENIIFTWIDDTLRELSDEDIPNFDKLKDEVLNRLPDLADISINHVTKLVDSWLSNDQKVVISKLEKVKHLQFKYVESVLEKNKDNIESYMTHVNIGGNTEEKFEQYSSLLILHIKLLCELNPKMVY